MLMLILLIECYLSEWYTYVGVTQILEFLELDLPEATVHTSFSCFDDGVLGVLLKRYKCL